MTWRLGLRRLLGHRDIARRDRRVIAELLRTPAGRRAARALMFELGSFGHLDDDTLRGQLEAALDRGLLVLVGEEPRVPKLDPQFRGTETPRIDPPPPPAPEPEIVDKSLLIIACSPELSPRSGPITITYLIRELAGQAVTLTLSSNAYPGKIIFEQALDAAQSADGRHDLTWDGTITIGPRAEQRAEPDLSPILVDLRHDESYNDQDSFIIVPKSVEVLALGDFNFSTDREVMLPGPSSDGERQGDLVDGVALVAGILAHLRELDEERRVLVAGHTDAAGSVAHNLALSERRADNVQRFLAGDRDSWAAHCHQYAEVADGQEVLRWVRSRYGWPCDPGTVDNEDGPKTHAGRSAFRARYEHELGRSAGSTQTFELADWAAFFDLYTLDLAARLGTNIAGLDALRQRLMFCDPSFLGCSEHWPNDGVERPAVCRDNRRVEVLMFHPDELPEPADGGEPPGASIYAPRIYRWLAVTPGPGPHPVDGPCFELALAIDELDSLPKDAGLRLHGGPYDLRIASSAATRDGGFSRFHFHGVAVGVRYSLELESAELEAPVTLFSDADLDMYIDGIGDAEAAVAPILFASLPFLEDDEGDGPFIDGGALSNESADDRWREWQAANRPRPGATTT